MSESRAERWLRPRVVFSVLAFVVIATVLFSRSPVELGGRTYSSYSRFMSGTRALYETMAGLGWRVTRRTTPWREPLDSDAVLVVISPAESPSATEMHALLDAVRRGARVLAVPLTEGPMADSLRARATQETGARYEVVADSVLGRTGGIRPRPVENAARAACCFSRYLRPVPLSEKDTTPRFPADTETLAKIQDGAQTKPVILARRVGAGIILLVADGDPLRNASLHSDDNAVFAVRLLEWLDPGGRRRVVFDEWHQGLGDHPTMPGTVWDGVLHTPSGRMLLQACVAGLLLLIAIGVRPIAPVARTSIERRSPLEHVGALARAYEAIGATQLATRRLVRGLRRRHPAGAAAFDDAGYLDALGRRVPSLALDVATLRTALERPLPAAEWVRTGGAITNIERTLTP